MNEVIYEAPKRVDTTTAPAVEAQLKEILEQGTTELAIDMAGTTYISSVGLRVLLSAQKTMNKRQGSMVIRHVCPQVKEVFDLTGFSGFLRIED